MNGEHKKTLAILGATGSIGRSVLDIVGRYDDQFSITVLAAHHNAEMLAELALRHRPRHVVLIDPDAFGLLQSRLSETDIIIHQGVEGLLACLDEDVDLTINGISGVAGLLPSLRVLENGGTLAIANKESLVAAGALLKETCRRHNGVILPTDSEHNAIFQVWSDRHVKAIRSIILTASGGPFLNTPISEFPQITAAQALRHPRWSMGPKISVDSATMMNKGLEIIEACVLFDLPEDKVEVKVHPQSVVHGMISYNDGSMVAQLGPADMRVPLSYVLAWPDRLPWLAEDVRPADEPLLDFSQLDFLPLDPVRFPAVELARQAWRQGGLAPCIMNAANEVAVDAFLNHHIRFTDIIAGIEHTLSVMSEGDDVSLDAVLETNEKAMAITRSWIAQKEK